jgi:excisionase family DNA binding protein
MMFLGAVVTADAAPGSARAAIAAAGIKAAGTSRRIRRIFIWVQLSLSRSVIYNQLRTGRLRSVKEGNARLIPAEAIAEYVALLEAEVEASR